MDTIQAAKQVILDAEVSLRDLISTALANQKYGEVKEIAELADRVAQLITSNNIQLSVSIPAKVEEPPRPDYELTKQEPVPETRKLDLPPVVKARAVKKRVVRRKPGYPKFVRDGDRLVKVGWSKKNKAEYEHRVPRDAVQGFLRHLDHMVEPAKVFEIESLFPVRDSSGEEVPGYQIYVIVAWLREAGVIEKKGRDGYLMRDKSVLGETNELWNSLQPRTA